MRLVTPFILLVVASSSVQAQTPGTCAPGRAEAVLDANDVSARVFNGGNLFFRDCTFTGGPCTGGNAAAYHVPAASGRSPLFAAGLWVGGRVNGQVRIAAARYANWQFWPGPLDPATARPVNPADCSPYDRIWRVSREDVRAYLRTGVPTPDLAAWPWHLGAPVLDGDGDPANYDLAGGDQPAIEGEQAAWWVMNDVGNTKVGAVSAPLGLEVQVTAFAAASGRADPRERGDLDQTTYYRYRLINRNARPIDDAYVAFFADVDLGNSTDDYLHADTLVGMGVVYNTDNNDETSTGYGQGPPALGFVVAQGPVGLANGRDDDRDGAVDEEGERLSMTGFRYYIGGGPVGTNDPTETSDYYYTMQGLWGDGVSMREGGTGRGGSGRPTRFAFPGDPVTGAYWSEENTGAGRNTPGDRRFTVGSGPFRLDPGEVEDVTLAIIFARGSERLGSVRVLRGVARQAAYNVRSGLFVPTRVTLEAEPPPPEPKGPDDLRLLAPRPNPFEGEVTVGYELPQAMRVRVAAYDVLGREVAVLAGGLQEAGTYDLPFGAGLPAGTYLLRFEAGGAARTLVLTKRP